MTHPIPSSLHDALTPVPRGDGTFALTARDGWQQGRGAFGGLVLGALASAVCTAEGDSSLASSAPRRLRSLTGEIPAPVPIGAEAILRVEALRRGRGTSTWHARLEHEGEVLAVANVVLGASRNAEPSRATSRKSDSPRWRDVPVAPIGPPFGPTFLQHFELRSTGPVPLSGGALRCEGFVRPRVRGALGAAEVIALADTYWPTLLVGERAPRPAATIAYSLQLLVDPATLDPEEPLFHQARELGHAEGFVAELRELFTPEGTLVAVNLQTFAVIK